LNILIVIQLKLILANVFLFGSLDTPKECKEEYDLINFLACGIEDYAFINEDFIPWNPEYDSYEALNPKNKNFAGQKEKYDLDEIFDENQRQEIDDFLKSKHPSKVKSHSLKCKSELNKSKVPDYMETIYSYSYPIISEGIDNEIYGIILESVVFGPNYTLYLKIYKKHEDTWDLVQGIELAFS
jgi:hypothetical protein